MARYYDITIGGGSGLHWTSHPSGPSGPRDTGALNVELDLNAVPADQPMGTGFCRVWGPGLDVISQSKSIANQPITIMGGMGAGLPLSNPSQAGLLVQGTINKLFANWEGTNQSIDLQITLGGTGQVTASNPGPNPQVPPLNFTLNWLKGQPLATALQQAIQQGMPGVNIAMNISSAIVAPQDQIGYYKNIFELASYVRRYSQMILGGQAPGVSIAPNGMNVTVDDGSTPQQAGQIQFQDLVGQPTWIDINTISFKCIMRADIKPLQTVTMPANTVGLGQQSLGAQTNQLAFQGSFYVTKVRHVGNFRQPDGSAWVSIFEASSQSGASQ